MNILMRTNVLELPTTGLPLSGRRFYRFGVTLATPNRVPSRHSCSIISSEPRPAATTASAHHAAGLVSRLSPTQNVVETLAVPLLKTMHIPGSDLTNCEGSAKGRSTRNDTETNSYPYMKDELSV